MYPGGAPISRDTLKRSMYSLMSTRSSEFAGSLNRNSLSALASSVLPTPYVAAVVTAVTAAG